MALGLPVAVTIGWQMATPAIRSAAIDTPGGAGGMGNAPARHARPAAAPPASVSSIASPQSTTPTVAPTVAVSTPVGPVIFRPPATGTPTGAPSAPPTEASQDPLPPLTEPPVPTPTEPNDPNASTSPSAAPSEADTVDPQGHLQWPDR